VGRILSAIDIGSNTVHLLVGEVNVDGVRKIQDSSEWLSLGEMVGRDRIISPALQQQLVLTLNTFKQLASENGAEGVYVFATEAIRKSSNSKEVLKLIQKATGLTVDVVSGRREAELGLRGALLDTRSASFLLADVGGGSAQIARCTKKRMLV